MSEGQSKHQWLPQLWNNGAIVANTQEECGGQEVIALVDTGCTSTMVQTHDEVGVKTTAVRKEVLEEAEKKDSCGVRRCCLTTALHFAWQHWKTCWRRATYRPNSNGIMERNWTIKTVVEWGGTSSEEAVFSYNISPKSGQDDTALHVSVYKYAWRPPKVELGKQEETTGTIELGEEVWVKPSGLRCMTQWGRDRVTENKQQLDRWSAKACLRRKTSGRCGIRKQHAARRQHRSRIATTTKEGKVTTMMDKWIWDMITISGVRVVWKTKLLERNLVWQPCCFYTDKVTQNLS